MSNIWKLPPSPPPPLSLETLNEALRDIFDYRQLREELAALEELCKLAHRDGKAVAVQKHQGRIVDAQVIRYGQPRTIYYFEFDPG